MSNARDRILREINEAGLSQHQTLAATPINAITYTSITAAFANRVVAIGGKIVWLDDANNIETAIAEAFSEVGNFVYILPGTTIDMSPESLYEVELACIWGKFGVAENGAIWVTEKDMGNRLLPFSCQHLVLIINENNVVNNMHEAYSRIGLADIGYGVFIAGPSKTADIEQSLVIGAHGPISLTVFIIRE